MSFSHTAPYAPVPYLPQATGIAVGRALDAPPLMLLYLGRIFNLLTSMALITLAIAITPVWRWVMCCCALLPMALFEMASLSADALTIAVGLLLTAMVLRLHAGLPTARKLNACLLALAIICVLMTLCKTAYAPLVGLALVVPRCRTSFSRRNHVLYLGGIAATCGLAQAVWSAFNRQAYAAATVVQSTGTAPTDRLHDLGQAPLRVAAFIALDGIRQAPTYAHELVGVLGWLDTALSLPVTYAALLLLLAAALFDRAPVLRPIQRAVLASMVTLAVGVISIVAYIYFTPAGSPIIQGIQGRYLLPLTPALLLLLPHTQSPRLADSHTAAWCIFGVEAIVLALTVQTLLSGSVVKVRRIGYAGGYVPDYFVQRPTR